MRLSQFTFITLLTGSAFGAIEDEVTCILNKFRNESNVEPLKISTKLMISANETAAASLAARNSTLVVPGDKSFADSLKRAGYEVSSVKVLGGQGYKNSTAFAEAMIQKYPDVIKEAEFKHLGFAKSKIFYNLDLADSLDDNEPTRDAVDC